MKNKEANLSYNKKNKKKLISNLIFFGLATILLIILIFSLGEIQNIFSTLGQIGQSGNWKYLIIAILLTLAYFFMYPLSLCTFGKKHLTEYKFKDAYMVGCSEHFYNGVTPFAAGGQPFQIYSFSKRGNTVAKSTSVVLANFVIFMIVTNLIAIISLFFWPYFVGNINNIDGVNASWFIPVAITGFVINFLVLLFMIALGCSKKIRNGIIGLTKLLAKIKFLNKLITPLIPKLEEYCENAQIGFKQIFTDFKTSLVAFIFKLVSMILYYSVPFFLLKSVGVSIEFTFFNFILVFFGTSFAITAVVFVPTPGGTVGIELAFSIVIASISSGAIGQSQAIALLWRLLTYYLIIFLSFGFSAFFERSYNKQLKLESRDNND